MYKVQEHTGGFHKKRETSLRDGNMSIPTRITYIFTIYELNHNKTYPKTINQTRKGLLLW